MSKPGLATVLTLNMITIWNDYLFSLIIGGKQELYNITELRISLRESFYTDYWTNLRSAAFQHFASHSSLYRIAGKCN